VSPGTRVTVRTAAECIDQRKRRPSEALALSGAYRDFVTIRPPPLICPADDLHLSRGRRGGGVDVYCNVLLVSGRGVISSGRQLTEKF